MIFLTGSPIVGGGYNGGPGNDIFVLGLYGGTDKVVEYYGGMTFTSKVIWSSICQKMSKRSEAYARGL